MNMKKYEITAEEYTAVVKARKATQNKKVARRLHVIELRYEGKTSKEIAEKRGFQNEIFDSLETVIDRLCFNIKNLPATVIKSITGRKWILSIF